MTGRERKDHGKSPIQQYDGKTPKEVVAYPQVGYSDWRGKPSGTSSSHQNASQTSSGNSAGKKAQILNCNHLLNFHYDPIPVSRPQLRAPPPRRQQKRRPYNKDLFFQANYKFVVLDTGNYAAESIDPDKMLCWEDIICFKYATPFPVQCPICLDNPLCPQITSCGHIFCFPCILQYFSMDENDLKDECWKKCPLCFTMISSKDLYTICVENVEQYHVGDVIDFVLLTRGKDSFSSSVKNNKSSNIQDEILDSFTKFTLTSDVELSFREAMSDLDSWIARADSGLVDDIEKLPYVCAAMEQLERRKKYWNEHRNANADKANYGSPPSASVASAKNNKSDRLEKSSQAKLVDEFGAPKVTEFKDPSEDHEKCSSSSFDDNNNDPLTHSNEINERKDGDSYNFYQVFDLYNILYLYLPKTWEREGTFH